MDVRILGAVVVVERVDHRLRLLGRGRVVRVDEGLAPHRVGRDGKVLADPLDGERLAQRGGRRGAAQLGSKGHDASLASEPVSTVASSEASSWARSGSIGI